MMAIHTKVLRELLNSKRWSQRLESAKTLEQAASVLEAFCQENKRQVVYLSAETRQRMPAAAA